MIVSEEREVKLAVKDGDEEDHECGSGAHESRRKDGHSRRVSLVDHSDDEENDTKNDESYRSLVGPWKKNRGQTSFLSLLIWEREIPRRTGVVGREGETGQEAASAGGEEEAERREAEDEIELEEKGSWKRSAATKKRIYVHSDEVELAKEVLESHGSVRVEVEEEEQQRRRDCSDRKVQPIVRVRGQQEC